MIRISLTIRIILYHLLSPLSSPQATWVCPKVVGQLRAVVLPSRPGSPRHIVLRDTFQSEPRMVLNGEGLGAAALPPPPNFTLTSLRGKKVTRREVRSHSRPIPKPNV